MDPFKSRAVAAMLDRDDVSVESDDALPPLWQWFYFLSTEPQRQLASDGHPVRGGFMPPVPLPRRMFAGARMIFHHALTIGQPARREATIKDVVIKSGQSGSLVFVTVVYRYLQNGIECITEEQDIVYREPGAAVQAPPQKKLSPVADGTWSREVQADSRLLFRFSALTFNAHRIHYDRQYAENEEGYPGLIVHGPLTAILLADLVHKHDARRMQRFDFRGKAPIFDLAPFRLCGTCVNDRVELEAQGPDGKAALVALVQFD